jgi:hypothetical protein
MRFLIVFALLSFWALPLAAGYYNTATSPEYAGVPPEPPPPLKSSPIAYASQPVPAPGQVVGYASPPSPVYTPPLQFQPVLVQGYPPPPPAYRPPQPQPVQAMMAYAPPPPAYVPPQPQPVVMPPAPVSAPLLPQQLEPEPEPVLLATQPARESSLGTRTGLEGAFDFSHYRYEEPSLGMSLDGLKYGFDLDGTYKFSGSNWFVNGDLRFAYGLSDYSGSGAQKDNSEYLWDLRSTFGRDFFFSNVGLSPYTGLGYRFLYSDIRGLTDTLAVGYRRESQYVYLPMGVTTRFRLFNNNSRIAVNMEYDQFLFGNQRSFLTDTSLHNQDLENSQDSGYGLRGSVLYESGRWSVGPFFNYWNIDDSDVQCTDTICGLEPANETWEYGLRFGYRFF